MNQDILTFHFSLQSNLIILILAWVRIVPVFFFLPFLNSKLLHSNIVKNCVAIFIALGLFPFFSSQEIALQKINIASAVFYELSVGLTLALILGTPFIIANIIGELIDNQRGATITNVLDPANGAESSEMSIVVSHIVCMIFLAQGGIYQVAQIIADSYRFMPFIAGFSQYNSLPLGGFLSSIIKQAIILSSPILVTLFICEVALGLYSRFCPQLNVFSLSLSIKSIVSFSVFLLYFHNETPLILTNMISLVPFYDSFSPMLQGN